MQVGTSNKLVITVLLVLAGQGQAMGQAPEMTSPANDGDTLAQPAVFEWTDVGADWYRLVIGSTLGGADLYNRDQGSALTATVYDLPSDGSMVYVRITSSFSGTRYHHYYTYQASSGNDGVAVMTSPANDGDTLAQPAVFEWTDVGADRYWLTIGSTFNGNEYYSKNQYTATSATIYGLPTDGSVVYVRLTTTIGGVNHHQHSDYLAHVGGDLVAKISDPAPDSTLGGAVVVFTRTSVGADSYWLTVGSTPAGNDYFAGFMSDTTKEVTGLPVDGSPVYVRLRSRFGPEKFDADFQYTASLLFTDSGQSLGSSYSMSVALGDVDGDGDLDAFVANNSQGNRVWINDGSGIFVDSGQSLGTSASFGVDMGDVDGDGDLDAFVVNYGGQGARVWLNDGAGTFMDSGQILGSTNSRNVVLGDLDGDGDLDAFIAVATGQGSRVWLNDGTGTFTDSGQILGSNNSLDVSLGDLDGDGDLDAFVANYSGEGDRVWLNDGTGNFVDSGQSLGIYTGWSVDLGDVDGDGDLDAIVTNFTQGVRVWFNDGDGSFTEGDQILLTAWSRSVRIGDVDGDGDLDAVIGSQLPDEIWLNDGDGGFIDSGLRLGSVRNNCVSLGDLDGDGSLDIFLANEQQPNTVWWGN